MNAPSKTFNPPSFVKFGQEVATKLVQCGREGVINMRGQVASVIRRENQRRREEEAALKEVNQPLTACSGSPVVCNDMEQL